jgi:hypothetical protein
MLLLFGSAAASGMLPADHHATRLKAQISVKNKASLSYMCSCAATADRIVAKDETHTFAASPNMSAASKRLYRQQMALITCCRHAEFFFGYLVQTGCSRGRVHTACKHVHPGDVITPTNHHIGAHLTNFGKQLLSAGGVQRLAPGETLTGLLRITTNFAC